MLSLQYSFVLQVILHYWLVITLTTWNYNFVHTLYCVNIRCSPSQPPWWAAIDLFVLWWQFFPFSTPYWLSGYTGLLTSCWEGNWCFLKMSFLCECVSSTYMCCKSMWKLWVTRWSPRISASFFFYGVVKPIVSYLSNILYEIMRW